MSKKKTVNKDPDTVTRQEVDAGGKVVAEVQMPRKQVMAEIFELREHNLREKYVMLHGKQGGILAALSIASELGMAGASAMTIVRTLDALHDDWRDKMDEAREELQVHVCEEPANLPCLDCGEPTVDCAGDNCRHHDHDHDDIEDGERDE